MNRVAMMLVLANMPHMPQLRMHNYEHHCAPIRRKRWKRRLRDHSTRVKRCGKGK